jgi:hypothetical protein
VLNLRDARCLTQLCDITAHRRSSIDGGVDFALRALELCPLEMCPHLGTRLMQSGNSHWASDAVVEVFHVFVGEAVQWHYTPKHGSWLDLAESELGVLTSQCLDRRIPDKQTLIEEIAAWEHDRNANHTKADWQHHRQQPRECCVKKA